MAEESDARHGSGDHETWHFVMGLRISPRDLQLVAVISDTDNPRESIVYFVLVVMCTPITNQMLQESKALREWCNVAKLDLGRNDEAFTWSADGTFNGVASSRCVLWTHSSIEQLVMPKARATEAVLSLGSKLARTLKRCCNMTEIELLFEIKANHWQIGHPATIGHTETVGALKYIVNTCQSTLMLGQLDNQISSYHYKTREPHVSVLDLAVMELFGQLKFYTYKGSYDDRATTDYKVTTVYFSKQDEIVKKQVRRKRWYEMDLDTFLHYTHDSQYKALLSTPGAMPEILQKHCGKPKRPSGRKSRENLSQKMNQLSLQ